MFRENVSKENTRQITLTTKQKDTKTYKKTTKLPKRQQNSRKYNETTKRNKKIKK